MRARYDNIQVLRVLACLGVFFTHLAPRIGAKGGLYAVMDFGASGVYLFFLISGFLACDSPVLTGKLRWRETLAYYIRRLFRILPLYYALVLYQMVLHTFVLRDVAPDPGGLYWGRYFFVTSAFIPAPNDFWGNLGATWTVGLFAVFYLCAPFLVRLAGGSVRRSLCLYLAALALRCVWVGLGLSAWMMFFYYLHYFVLGILMKCLADRKGSAKAAIGLALLAAVLRFLLFLLGLEADFFWQLSCLYGVLLLFTLPFSWEPFSESPLRKAVAVLDEYSYEIYLIHAAVMEGISLLQAHAALPAAAVLPLSVLLTAAGAWLSRRLIENPAGKWGRKLVAAVRI